MNAHYITIPIAYNHSPTTGPGCFQDRGSLSCPGGILLSDGDIGSAELDTSKVFAWNREFSIALTTSVATMVKQVNLFFYNIPSSGIGLPPAELFWSDVSPLNPNIPLSHAIVGNQDLSQDDSTLRNVSLVVTTDQEDTKIVLADYRYFRIHFTFPAETILIDWILLSEIQLCEEAGTCVSVLLQAFPKTAACISWHVMYPSGPELIACLNHYSGAPVSFNKCTVI